jgi:EAL domain-containing protein (putative c-di-GMP-specific phosphodiesterase class I)/GGDEF domain-containing protein
MASTSPSCFSETPLEAWARYRDAVERGRPVPEGRAMAVLQLHFTGLRQLAPGIGHLQVLEAVAEVAARIRGALRPGDTLVAIGTGALLLVLPDLLSAQHAELAAHRVLREVEAVRDSAGGSVALTASVGVVVATADTEAAEAGEGDDAPERLQRAAAAAALLAAERGVGHLVARGAGAEPLFAPLREALATNALTLAFQPIFALDGERPRMVGVEALARWVREDGGQVSPAVFVELAERTGLVGELTRWSLQAALREFAPLHARRPGLHCAINISALAFEDATLAEQILGAISLWRIDPGAVLIELTETALLRDFQRVARALGRLRGAGVGVAIDDFGQGYSSFGYLRELRVDVLKIDRGFIADRSGPRADALLEAMVGLAGRLDMRALAEGIEDEAMLARVRALGIGLGQGFGLARPAPMAQWLAAMDAGEAAVS